MMHTIQCYTTETPKHIQVLIDVLLSLLVRESRLQKTLVKYVFRVCVCDTVNDETLDQLWHVITEPIGQMQDQDNAVNVNDDGDGVMFVRSDSEKEEADVHTQTHTHAHTQSETKTEEKEEKVLTMDEAFNMMVDELKDDNNTNNNNKETTQTQGPQDQLMKDNKHETKKTQKRERVLVVNDEDTDGDEILNAHDSFIISILQLRQQKKHQQKGMLYVYFS